MPPLRFAWVLVRFVGGQVAMVVRGLGIHLRKAAAPPKPVIFDRTPLDYLAYLAATGTDPRGQADAAALQLAFGSLDLLVITLITPETEQVLPAADLPGLRAQMNDALLELAYGDPLNAGTDVPVLELSGPLDGRLDAVLAALDQAGPPASPD